MLLYKQNGNHGKKLPAEAACEEHMRAPTATPPYEGAKITGRITTDSLDIYCQSCEWQLER